MRSNCLSQWIVPGLFLAAVFVSGCARAPRSKPPTIAALYERASVIAAQSDANLQCVSANQTNASSLHLDYSDKADGIPLPVLKPTSLTTTPAPASPGGATLVSEFFEDTDVLEALELLARQAEVSLVIGERVGGRTSAYIEDIPFEDALRQILLPLGHAFRYRNGAYYIGALDPESNLFRYLATEHSYRPTYLDASELKDMLPQSLQKFVRVSEKRHMVQVEAPNDVAKDILRRLASYDLPVPQVVLEALVCVISPNQSSQFGIDTDHSLAEGGSNLLDLGLSGLVFGGSVSPYGVRNAFNSFAQTSAFVRLLAQEGYVAIRASPRVMARDGDKAEISIARENYFSVQPNSSNVADIFVRQEIQKVESGIALQLTPRILGDRITVTIDKAEVSENVQLAGPASVVNNPYPQINRRTVSTTVEVADGETIVIGGLVQKQTVDRVTKIPGLGSIPGIGKLFSTIERQDEEAEIVVFISPRLVYGSEARTQQSCGQTDLPDNSPETAAAAATIAKPKRSNNGVHRQVSHENKKSSRDLTGRHPGRNTGSDVSAKPAVDGWKKRERRKL